MNFFRFYLLLILGCFLATSCRSHKDTAVAESVSIVQSSTVQSQDKLTKVSDENFHSSVSFDSIEIFIKKIWDIPHSQSSFLKEADDSLVSKDESTSLYEVNFAKSTQPRTEIIGIKAYNAKVAASSHSQDSVSASKDSSLAIDLSMESQKEETGSSNSVAVYDPPDMMAVVVWAFIIVAAILIIVYFIKRKSNP